MEWRGEAWRRVMMAIGVLMNPELDSAILVGLTRRMVSTDT